MSTIPTFDEQLAMIQKGMLDPPGVGVKGKWKPYGYSGRPTPGSAAEGLMFAKGLLGPHVGGWQPETGREDFPQIAKRRRGKKAAKGGDQAAAQPKQAEAAPAKEEAAPAKEEAQPKQEAQKEQPKQAEAQPAAQESAKIEQDPKKRAEAQQRRMKLWTAIMAGIGATTGIPVGGTGPFRR